MADIVITLPVRSGEEAMFGAFLNRFLETCGAAAERWVDSDCPYLMMHSQPQPDLDLKVLTFQQRRAAKAFRDGWAAARIAAAAG